MRPLGEGRVPQITTTKWNEIRLFLYFPIQNQQNPIFNNLRLTMTNIEFIRRCNNSSSLSSTLYAHYGRPLSVGVIHEKLIASAFKSATSTYLTRSRTL